MIVKEGLMTVKLILVHFSQVDKEANRIKCKAQGILYKRTIKEFSVGCVTQHSALNTHTKQHNDLGGV